MKPSFDGIPTTVNLSFVGLQLNLHRVTVVRIIKFFESIEFSALEELEKKCVCPPFLTKNKGY